MRIRSQSRTQLAAQDCSAVIGGCQLVDLLSAIASQFGCEMDLRLGRVDRTGVSELLVRLEAARWRQRAAR